MRSGVKNRKAPYPDSYKRLDLDVLGGILLLKVENLTKARDAFLTESGAYLDKSASLRSEFFQIETDIAKTEAEIRRLDDVLLITGNILRTDRLGAGDHGSRSVERATAQRVKNKELRRDVVSRLLVEYDTRGTAKALAEKMQAVIKKDPKLWGLARVPAVSTIQNDITEIRKTLRL